MSSRTVAIAFIATVSPLLCADDFHFDRKGTIYIGGGAGIPMHPTSQYATTAGAAVAGAGFDFNKEHSIVGEFMWVGLTPNRASLPPVVNPLIAGTNVAGASSDLFAGTANYMYRREGHRFGVYGIGGGGWYYRHAELTQKIVQPGTPCSVNLLYWGYTCTSGSVVLDNTIVSKGASAFGGNVGFGITIRLVDSGEKFYIESRYHYAPTKNVSTNVLPIIFGFRW